MKKTALALLLLLLFVASDALAHSYSSWHGQAKQTLQNRLADLERCLDFHDNDVATNTDTATIWMRGYCPAREGLPQKIWRADLEVKTAFVIIQFLRAQGIDNIEGDINSIFNFRNTYALFAQRVDYVATRSSSMLDQIEADWSNPTVCPTLPRATHADRARFYDIRSRFYASTDMYEEGDRIVYYPCIPTWQIINPLSYYNPFGETL